MPNRRTRNPMPTKTQLAVAENDQPALRQVKPVRLFEGAVGQIRALIIDGQLQPGEKLPSESELCVALDVSRSSVREALRTLESKGLIQVRSGSGAYVAANPFSFNVVSEAVQWLLKRQDSLVQLLQVREVVEGLAASLVAALASEELLTDLRRIIEEQAQLSGVSSNLSRQAELDARFHLLIAEASGNPIAQEIISAIVPAFIDSNRAVLYVSTNIERSLLEHQAIIDALASRDPARAEAAVRSHIARVRTEIHDIHRKGEDEK